MINHIRVDQMQRSNDGTIKSRFVLHDGEASGTGRLGRTIEGLRQLLRLLHLRGYEVCTLGELLPRSTLAAECPSPRPSIVTP